MFADSLALSPDTPTDVDTNTVTQVRRYGDVNKSEFSVAGLTAPTEQKLLISHEVDKNGVHGALVKMTYTKADTLGIVGVGSVSLNFRRPANSAFTDAVMISLVYQIIDLLIEGGAGANITKLLNKEI